ncbi:sensor histidine kinase [Sinomicrobium weinanense]|uniref:histidine kinase n=1 Tax=Sinomicrobium weinanense TaxID=2842200 RepID=A0A926JS68_9FLAO|nr:histidine kinase [Sinomicrobium weinanense]MBC9796334.1 histidine kinase [Sinomicrobium weinanense]MBU3122464.1 histidine kinase [Sinomicrobium weinanense]
MANEKEIISLIIYVSVLIVILVIFVVAFFLAYHRQKTKLLIEKAEDKKRFEEELAKTQTEIQEQTLKNVSWELHDNIGQLLSVAKMQLTMLENQVPEAQKKQFEEATDILGRGVNEIRQLSHSLNADFILNVGLEEALRAEVGRFKRLNFLKVDFKVEGKAVSIDKKDEVIIFRIFQECFSNCIKYSRATLLSVCIRYLPGEVVISAADNGVGFDLKDTDRGVGIFNMRRRAALIGAKLSLNVKINEGVSVTLVYPYKPTKTKNE